MSGVVSSPAGNYGGPEDWTDYWDENETGAVAQTEWQLFNRDVSPEALHQAEIDAIAANDDTLLEITVGRASQAVGHLYP